LQRPIEKETGIDRAGLLRAFAICLYQFFLRTKAGGSKANALRMAEDVLGRDIKLESWLQAHSRGPDHPQGYRQAHYKKVEQFKSLLDGGISPEALAKRLTGAD
jgi:hypothetical protein